MAQLTAMDPARLLDIPNKKVVPYFNELRQQGLSDLKIGEQLLGHVRSESLPPYLFTILLSWSKSPELLARCLSGDDAAAASRGVRRAALKKLGCLLADAALWKKVWEALGGTAGLVGLFARSSVEDVKGLARAISFGGRKLNKPEEQASATTDLLRALVPSHYTSDHPSQDKRPIQHHYARMARACSHEFLGELLRSRDKSNPLYTGFIPARIEARHGAWMQKQVVDMLTGHIPEDGILRSFLKNCVASEPATPTEDRRMSASMAFSMRLLRGRLDGTFQDKWWQSGRMEELVILSSVFHRKCKKGAAKAELDELAIFAFELAEAKPNLRTSPNLRFMWHRVFGLWKKQPTQRHEKMVVRGLRWGLGGAPSSLGQACLGYMTSLPDELKWTLLRLYCLHVPNRGVDIDAAHDLTVLANQKWPYALFEGLLPVAPQKVIALLKGLLDVNPDYSFLGPPSGSSILSLSDLMQQRNFNVELLLTILQREDLEVQRKSSVSVDNIRKKSATARDQHHRAQFAKGAAALAISTGNLSIYADTITWQQRFVRDPLTVKVIFASGVVDTKEGIELLSGIPTTLPVACTLDDLAQRMDTADSILLTLSDSYKQAKAEPSFSAADWNPVQRLFGSVFMHRYSRLSSLPKDLAGVSHVDIFGVVWGRTMKMVDALGADFVHHITGSIQHYIQGLPPTSLAIATRTLLDTDNKRRGRKDRQIEDTNLETLSYTALLQLAQSDKPKLAHELIVQTILDRPDASSWHRQFLTSAYLKRLQAESAKEFLFAFAQGIGEKLEEQSFVKVGEAEPAKHAPPRSLVKVTTVKHLAQLLDNAEFVSVEAAVEVLAELLRVATHRDIRIATLQSLFSVLAKLSPGDDGEWQSNPLVVKILTAVETIIPVASSVNGRSVIDWEEAFPQRELPEISEDNSDLLNEVLLGGSLGSRFTTESMFKGLASCYVERIIWPIWQGAIAEHRRWVELFLLKYNAPPATIRDLPDIPALPASFFTPWHSYWKMMPQTALDIYQKHTMWNLSRPEAFRNFIASFQSNATLRKQPDVMHFLRTYDTHVYEPRDIKRMMGDMAITDPKLARLIDMVVGQCAVMLEDYASNIDHWHGVMMTQRAPVRNEWENAAQVTDAQEWNSKGRVVLERMTDLVSAKKEACRQQGRHALLPSTTALCLWLHPFPRLSKGQDIETACREYATVLRQTLISLLEEGNHHLQWHKIAQEAKGLSVYMKRDEEKLRVAAHLGKLVTDTSSSSTTTTSTDGYNIRSALNLVHVSVAMHLIGDGKQLVLKWLEKDESNHKLPAAEKDRLARSLGGMIGTWRGSDDEMVREMALEWKREQSKLVAALSEEGAVGT